MSGADRRTGTTERVTERVIVMDADAASRRAAELAEEAAAEEVDPRPATGFLAIDLGATRLAAAIVDADGEVVLRDRVATPARTVWPVLTQLVSRVLAANPGEVRPGACGVTCPGPIDRGVGSMKPVGMPIWHDFPIRRELAGVTGLPVELDTPGRALALAELWCGEIAELEPKSQHFATIVLGDEVDGAFVTGGRIVEGLTGNLGQFGHVVVEPEGNRVRLWGARLPHDVRRFAGHLGEHESRAATHAGGDRRTYRDHGRPSVRLDRGHARRLRDRARGSGAVDLR